MIIEINKLKKSKTISFILLIVIINYSNFKFNNAFKWSIIDVLMNLAKNIIEKLIIIKIK